jgi:hypothetical protein
MNYRWLYEKNYGKIPLDEFGRSYQIHHIDGNRANNCLENFKCVSIQEHYDIHYYQGDYGACLKIAEKMYKTHEELSELATLLNLKKMQNGTHHFLDKKWRSEKAKKSAKTRINKGTHHFLDPEFQKEMSKRGNKKQIELGTHPFFNEEMRIKARKKMKEKFDNGTHGLLIFNKIKYICPYCDKQGNGPTMKRWHFENCKQKRKD